MSGRGAGGQRAADAGRVPPRGVAPNKTPDRSPNGSAVTLALAALLAAAGPAPAQPAPGAARAGTPADACAAYPPQAASPYVLPYPPGQTFEAWWTTGHAVPGNGYVGRYAVDFRMPVGTPVVAARAGVVVAARDTFPDGTADRPGRDLEENYVMVRHGDGTVARYLHLTRGGALVAAGDIVGQGERVGTSGNSGQGEAPHLHFDVQRCGPNLPPAYNRLPCGQTVPVTFRNARPHACGLAAGGRYRAEYEAGQRPEARPPGRAGRGP